VVFSGLVSHSSLNHQQLFCYVLSCYVLSIYVTFTLLFSISVRLVIFGGETGKLLTSRKLQTVSHNARERQLNFNFPVSPPKMTNLTEIENNKVKVT
jgi:hypothetical protein